MLILIVTVQLPANPRKRLNLLRCPDCTAHFYDDQTPPDYTEPALNSGGRVPFYVQQGAGLNLLIRPLAQLQRQEPCAYMEVGCGYGFGLDYALRTRNWRSVGIDPAPLAALGRQALRLPIESRYLREDDEARGTMDVVAGAEVVEHLPTPGAFVRTLHAMLRPGGVLVLTTPNGDDIGPETPPGVLIPLLSPGLHLIIQSAASLQRALHNAGFAHIRVEVDNHTLIAFASDDPLALTDDAGALRHELRRHLQQRAATTDPAGDPFLGFAGRAFQESVNDGDWAEADRVWSLLLPACRARFGLDLDGLDALPDRVAFCGLEEMVGLVPLNLAGLLYASAIRSLAAGWPRSALESRFRLAATAAEAMRRALRALAMEDGQTEAIGWAAEAEALLCAADALSPELIPRLAALRPSPSGAAPRLSLWLRALTTIVNAPDYQVAAEFVGTTGLHRLPFADPVRAPRTDAERDALYSLAILALNHPEIRDLLGGFEAARDRLARLRDHTPPQSGLWSAAMKAEIEARQALGDAGGVARLAKILGLPSPARRRRLVPAAFHFVRDWAAPAIVNPIVGRISLRQALYRWPEGEIELGPKICLFAHWDQQGTVRPDVLDHIARLKAENLSVVLVSNAGALQARSLASLKSICASIIVRRNSGYDFGAWRAALDELGLPRRDTELVILANDSVFGPFQELRRLCSAIDPAQADVWACTDSDEVAYHLQSYWMAFSRPVLDSAAWRAFWSKVRPAWNKRWLVRTYEVGLTQALMRAGFRCRAIWPLPHLLAAIGEAGSPAAQAQTRRVECLLQAGRPINPTCDLWRPLLQAGFPFIKRELLERNAAGVVDATECQSVLAAIPGASLPPVECQQGSSPAM